MKRIQLIAAALSLVMLTTVGAGVVAAKQTENPRQAGSSHIYFYDVAPSGTHGTGKLQINVDKHTFEFNGQGFAPSQQIALRARAVGDADFNVFATGKATKSGNLHVAGTWDKDAAPAEVIGSIYTYGDISTFNLYCGGAFVAKLACYYSTDDGATWTESDHTGDIPLFIWKEVELGSLGVPNGALVKIHAIVVGGKDRTGPYVFEYKAGSIYEAKYDITGTTWNPTLTYEVRQVIPP